MRNRQKQRALRRAGVRKEDSIPLKNAEGYFDLVPHDAVENIRKGKKHDAKNLL